MSTEMNHQADAAARNTIDNDDQSERAVYVAGQQSPPGNRQMSRAVKKGILFLLLVGAILGFLQFRFGLISQLAIRLLGPPQVELHEAYAGRETTSPFDHSALDTLLRNHVDADGWVDYAAIKDSESQLNAYLESVASDDMEGLGRDDRLAFLINAYNAFTLKLIVEHFPLDSIKEIPADQRWDAVRWNLAGQTVSLSQIEHELIRPNFAEPRIHFALVCAAIGCPPLLNEAYDGDRLEQQLTRQTEYVHQHDTWFQFDAASQELKLTQLYNWYGGDFEQAAGSVIQFASQQSAELKALVAEGQTPSISWLPYDWTLNDKANQEPR